MSTEIDPPSPRNQQRRSSSATMESISSAGSGNFEALPEAASGASPRSGTASAPVAHLSYQREPPPPHHHHRPLVSPRISFLEANSSNNGVSPSLSSISTSATYNNNNINGNPGGGGRASPLILPPQSVQTQSRPSPRGMSARRFLRAFNNVEAKATTAAATTTTTTNPGSNRSGRCVRAALAGGNILMNHHHRHHSDDSKVHRTLASNALAVNDSMVYLDGPRVYACQNCRTHLTSHDDIISKSFHGRHGRAYLFDVCVNVTIGPPEDRMLITGLHSVCDIFCKRCQKCVGWTYQKAYEASQKYKEGKFIIEKINLYLEDNSDVYDVEPPAGERQDKWRKRSTSWGSEECSGGGSGSAGSPYSHHHHHHYHHSHSLDQPMSPGGRSAASSLIYEYRPSAEDASSTTSASASTIPPSPSLPL